LVSNGKGRAERILCSERIRMVRRWPDLRDCHLDAPAGLLLCLDHAVRVIAEDAGAGLSLMLDA
jgi:hypothetical protein